MAMRTVYCVQAYAGTERRPLLQFGTEADALGEAQRLRTRAARVDVYSVTGEPDFDSWGEPELLASFVA